MAFDVDTLEHLMVGRRWVDDLQNTSSLTLLASSGSFTAQDALTWQGLIALDPIPAEIALQSQAVGLFHGPDGHLLLSQVIYRNGDPHDPLYWHVLVPRDVVKMQASNIISLVELISDTTMSVPESGVLPSIRIPPAPTWTMDKRFTLFSQLVDLYGGIDNVLNILGAILHDRHLVIRNYPLDLNARLDFVQSMMMLLPASARPNITFSTHVNSLPPASKAISIIFSEDESDTGRWVLDASQHIYPQGDELKLDYIESLRAMWQGDMKSFVADLRAMELMASVIIDDSQSLKAGLDQVARRMRFDNLVLMGEPIPADLLKSMLNEFPPQSDQLLIAYADQLLKLALDERDIEAVEMLDRMMERNQELLRHIQDQLQTLLSNEPDAVYFLVRTILLDSVDEAWLPLLHSAAELSMSVALEQDGDVETVMTWLKFIANEPATYQLQSIVKNSIFLAIPLTYQDGNLGLQLFLFTASRFPEIGLQLLDDQQLVAQMADPTGSAFRTYQVDAVQAVLEANRQVALMLLAQAIRDAPDNPSAGAIFTPTTINYLWGWYLTANQSMLLPEPIQPNVLIDQLITHGRAWMRLDAIETLMRLVMGVDMRDLFVHISLMLPQPADLPQILANVMAHSATHPTPDGDLKGENIVDVFQKLLAQKLLTQQQVLDVLMSINETRHWQGEVSLRLSEQVARMIQQNPALELTFEEMLYLLQQAEATKSDLIAKIIAKRLSVYLEQMPDETEQIALLDHLSALVAWSNTTRNQVMMWWREYVRTQSLSRLQAWDKALDHKKALEWARSIVQTTLSIRKMIGKRTLEEFADAIGTTYNILQAFSDSFDNRQHPYFDQPTFRQELDVRGAELTPDERNILAKNLRELADLIAELAENRSKATRIRREEEIERLLLSGEQSPQSAIDTMRWLSGFLSGLQDD
jgi:hypothetical protein